MQIPAHIINLAGKDVEIYGLPDGSVKKENKHPEVQKFIEDAWRQIDKTGGSFKSKQISLDAILRQIYPAEYNEQEPMLKQNSTLSQLFSERGIG